MQLAEPAVAGDQLERQVVRVEPAPAVRDQAAERMLRDQRVQRLDAGFVEMGWDVHGGSTVG
ncbi:hypothetical protein BUUB107078_32985 [Burkholderia ubonensis]